VTFGRSDILYYYCVSEKSSDYNVHNNNIYYIIILGTNVVRVVGGRLHYKLDEVHPGLLITIMICESHANGALR